MSSPPGVPPGDSPENPGRRVQRGATRRATRPGARRERGPRPPGGRAGPRAGSRPPPPRPPLPREASGGRAGKGGPTLPLTRYPSTGSRSGGSSTIGAGKVGGRGWNRPRPNPSVRRVSFSQPGLVGPGPVNVFHVVRCEIDQKMGGIFVRGLCEGHRSGVYLGIYSFIRGLYRDIFVRG